MAAVRRIVPPEHDYRPHAKVALKFQNAVLKFENGVLTFLVDKAYNAWIRRAAVSARWRASEAPH